MVHLELSLMLKTAQGAETCHVPGQHCIRSIISMFRNTSSEDAF